MDTPIKGKPVADLRDYLAEERTFLAWLRTGIALMGVGFVAARFGLFADEPPIMQYATGVQAHGLSLWFGTALVVIGVAVNLFSARRYMRLVSELNGGQFERSSLVIVFFTKELLNPGGKLAPFVSVELDRPGQPSLHFEARVSPDAFSASVNEQGLGASSAAVVAGRKRRLLVNKSNVERWRSSACSRRA